MGLRVIYPAAIGLQTIAVPSRLDTTCTRFNSYSTRRQMFAISVAILTGIIYIHTYAGTHVYICMYIKVHAYSSLRTSKLLEILFKYVFTLYVAQSNPNIFNMFLRKANF